MGIRLAKQRDQNITGCNVLTLGPLCVHQSSLQDSLKCQGLLGPTKFIFGQHFNFGKKLFELGSQLADVGAAVLEHGKRGFIVKHREQQVLELKVLVLTNANVINSALQGFF